MIIPTATALNATVWNTEKNALKTYEGIQLANAGIIVRPGTEDAALISYSGGTINEIYPAGAAPDVPGDDVILRRIEQQFS